MKPLFLTISGSKLHGTATSESDTDVKGFCLPEIDNLLGIKHFDQLDIKNNLTGKDKIEGQFDTVARQLAFIYKGDLRGSETCFATSPFWVYKVPLADEILSFAQKNLLTKNLFHSYNGYLKSQIHKILHSKRDGARKEMIEKYGLDVKCAMHAYRLARQATIIMEEGTLRSTLDPKDRTVALEIRNGCYKLDAVIELLNEVDRKMYEAYQKSKLKDEPDFDLINYFVTDLHIRYIKGEFDSQLISLKTTEEANRFSIPNIELWKTRI